VAETNEASVKALSAALSGHARFAALRARHALGEGLHPANLHRFLADPKCLRYPTELVFSREGLDAHQFAEPFYVGRGQEQRCCLHVDPRLQENREALCLVAAYMAAAINYGQAATPETALLQGSLLFGLLPEEFYARICRVADSLGLPHVSRDVPEIAPTGPAG
jgi:hypothetical protein